jgi:primosomal protein N' (replication factor Y) (superfamily II helicase)
VCVAVPKLSLDRPFTYSLPDGMDAGTGSLVSVPFHGRTVRGWILGPAAEPPATDRVLPVLKVRSPVRFFDGRMLELLRWVSERYLAPMSTVIERSHPPRIASLERIAEESRGAATPAPSFSPARGEAPTGDAAPLGSERSRRPRPPERRDVLAGYEGANGLLRPGAVTWLRPLPDQEHEVCLAAIEACLDGGHRALVLVPEAVPLPFTARSVLERFGGAAVSFVGGEPRERYRTWLATRRGRFDVVVSTRPGVFAPLSRLGLIWVSREVHPGHREDRSPYYHARDVAIARARLEGAACVLSSLVPSVETAVAVNRGTVGTVRPPRSVERARAPLVESVPVEAEDRSSRLATLLKTSRSGALIATRSGYGVARVCRTCGEPAACAACSGPLLAAGGRMQCRVCGASARCRVCGAVSFGIERGGTERVREWAGRLARVPVVMASEDPAEADPGPGRILVGTAAAVNDVGPKRLDLVGILDPDRALSRAGLHAGEQSLATWMEAAAWAGSRVAGGRVLVQTRHPEHPAIQALVRWDPTPFLLAEGRRLEEAGFPPGHAIFRLTGGVELEARLRADGIEGLLAVRGDEGTICLVAVRPCDLASFRQRILQAARAGTLTRVDAEPQL